VVQLKDDKRQKNQLQQWDRIVRGEAQVRKSGQYRTVNGGDLPSGEL